jgi:hypothetical protein
MNKNTNTIHKTSNKQGSFIDWITQYESLVVFGGFGIAIMAAIILNGMFQAGPTIRTNLLYNAMGAFAMAIGFIYLIFRFMGSNVVIMGKTVDMGMIVYIAIVLFIMFVLGN